jgi:hypothetical protein
MAQFALRMVYRLKMINEKHVKFHLLQVIQGVVVFYEILFEISEVVHLSIICTNVEVRSIMNNLKTKVLLPSFHFNFKEIPFCTPSLRESHHDTLSFPRIYLKM